MGSQVELQSMLKEVTGANAVYLQAPSSVSMTYPCIVCELSRISTHFADNNAYGHEKQYQLTVIYRNLNSDLPDKVAGLPRCRHDRHFVVDNLNHDIFSIYY